MKKKKSFFQIKFKYTHLCCIHSKKENGAFDAESASIDERLQTLNTHVDFGMHAKSRPKYYVPLVRFICVQLLLLLLFG